MNYPRWKVWLSYLTDLPLQKIDSAVNNDMRIWLSKGQLKLTTANAIYSYGLLYRSFAHAFDRLQLNEHPEIKTVLVLGWGIGSIGKLLANHPGIQHITAIEHDQSLVDFYQGELAGESKIPVEVICSDAVAFVNSCDSQFDLICSDVFVDNKSPDAIIQTSYLKQLDALRTQDGIVLLSKLNMSMADIKENAAFEERLKQIAPAFSKLDTVGNRVFVWGS